MRIADPFGAIDASTLTAAAELLADPAKAVEWIKIDSRVSPPVLIEEPFVQKEPSQGFDPLAYAKPKITIKLKAIDQPLEALPWGEPGPTQWPKIAFGLAAGLGLLGFFLYRGLTR